MNEPSVQENIAVYVRIINLKQMTSTHTMTICTA